MSTPKTTTGPVTFDPVTEAKNGFDRASRLRDQMDITETALSDRRDELMVQMDTIQHEYEGLSAQLLELNAQIDKAHTSSGALSDAMDSYDEVLRAHGIERERTP